MTLTSIPTLGESKSASPLRRIVSQALFETRALFRNGEQIMVSILLPLGLLIALGKTSVIAIETYGHSRLDFVVPGVMAIAIMASSFTSQAISTAFDRRNGVLRFLSTTPLGRGGLLGAKTCAVLIVALIQCALISIVSFVLGWNASFGNILLALVPLALGAAAFTAFAMLIAGTLRAEGVIALANIILVALIVAGGTLVPSTALPQWLEPIAQLLPSGALGDLFRSALLHGELPLLPTLVLIGWTALFGYGAARLFKWH